MWVEVGVDRQRHHSPARTIHCVDLYHGLRQVAPNGHVRVIATNLDEAAFPPGLFASPVERMEPN